MVLKSFKKLRSIISLGLIALLVTALAAGCSSSTQEEPQNCAPPAIILASISSLEEYVV